MRIGERIREDTAHRSERWIVGEFLAGKLDLLESPNDDEKRDVTIYLFIDDLLAKGTKEYIARETAANHFDLGKTRVWQIYKRWDDFFSVLTQDQQFLANLINDPGLALDVLGFAWFITSPKVSAILPNDVEK